MEEQAKADLERAAPLSSDELEYTPVLHGAAFAGFWVRLAASVVDWTIVAGGFVLVFRGVGPVSTENESAIVALFVLAAPPLYFWVFTGMRGQTVCKLVLEIQVVNRQGRARGLASVALRACLTKPLLFVIPFGLVGFLWMAWDSRKQGWHDMLAGSYVVKRQRSAG